VSQLVREVKVQAFLDHPNLISLYDFFADEDNFYLLLELACDGPLFELL
jgi:calcium-dependent protein kinase